MTRALVATMVMALLPTVARAQHSKRDAAELSAKLDAILHDAYAKKPAHPKKPAIAAKKERVHVETRVQPSPSQQPEAPPVSARPSSGDDSMANVIVHSMQIAFDPEEWPVHFAALPKTPDEIAAHIARLPKTPDEIAAHLARLPKTPQEIDAHLRRLDTALREQHHAR